MGHSEGIREDVGLTIRVLLVSHSLRNGGRLRLLRGSAPVERAIQGSGVGHLLLSNA